MNIPVKILSPHTKGNSFQQEMTKGHFLKDTAKDSLLLPLIFNK